MIHRDLIKNFNNSKELIQKCKHLDTEKMFKCVEDRQGGNFAIDLICPEEEWVEYAMEWAANDWYETFDFIGNTPEETISNIDEWWEITLVKV